MGKASISFSSKARIVRRASSLNRIASVLGCEVKTDEVCNVILSGETDKARKAFDVLKAYGYVSKKSELCFETGNSWLFIS